MESKARWYRKWDLDVPKEKILAVVAEWANPEHFPQYSKTRMGAAYTPEDTADLEGKKLVFRGEGKVFTFEFVGGHNIKFTEGDGAPVDCLGNIKTMDNEVYFINHLVYGDVRGRQITLIADLKNGCATICDAHFGTPNSNIDVGREFIFGQLDDYYNGAELHHFTDEMVGTAIAWNYGEGQMTIKHMYTSNIYYSYSAPTKMGGWMATNPADYVKIRDHLFLFSFVEERQHGLQAEFLIDTEKLHDIGCFFGVGTDHMSSACVGALGTKADIVTLF